MSRIRLVGVALAIALSCESGVAGTTTQEALLAALANSKLSLGEGVRQVAKSGSLPLSAKFEFDDHNKLSLSVYGADPATRVGTAEPPVLKELSGSPEQAQWKPETEVFKDVEHVARSAQQLALMSVSRFSIEDLLERARKSHGGQVFSITPEVRGHDPVAVVLVANKGKVNELVFYLTTGKAFGAKH